MRMDVDHYVVLGVPRIADAAEIRAAYVRLAKRYHPDVATGNRELAAFNFRQITEAYETLSDPDRRALYDARAHTALPSRATVAPLVHLAEAAARARRRLFVGAVAVGTILLTVGGYLVVRHVAAPGIEALAAEVARPADEAPPAESSKEEVRENPPRTVPTGSQPSQPGRTRPPPAGPVGAAAEAKVLKPLPIEVTSGQSVCVGDDGAKFAVINRNGVPSVLYNGASAVRASVQYAGKAMILLTNIVPNDSVMIGIMRGDESGTLVFHADARGNFGKPIGAKCEGLAY